jgi:methyl-accepting chemotaxis protein/putative methionine-R-sulfoxide reductase with GAF domain
MNILSRFREWFKNLNLFFKFQAALFLVSTTTLSVMGYFGYNQGRELLSERSFDLLNTITKNKKKAVENYFFDIKNQISTLAQNPSTLTALQEFRQTFAQNSLNNLPEADSVLQKFYQQDFASILKFNSLQENKIDFKPQEPHRVALQYKYIAANPNPDGFKSLQIKSNLTDEYDLVHQKYHPAFLNFQQKFRFEDILLISREGNVVYSVAKRVDFATNLRKGIFYNSNAARLFKQIIQSEDEEMVKFEDYENYIPAYFKPSAFVAIPIFEQSKTNQKGEKIGVLMFQINNEKITEILTNNLQWASEGLGISGETALVGADFKLRNDTRRFLEDPNFYVTNLKGKADSVTIEKIRRLKTTIMLREYQTQATMDAVAGKSGSKTNIDFLGNEVLDVYLPIDILGVRWAIITEMDGAEMFASTTVFRNQLLLIAAILFVVVTLIGTWLAKSLADPMRKIQREITLLAAGGFPKPSPHIYNDELGKIDAALNTLISSMKEVSNFAENVGNGNFDYDFKVRGERDILGQSLLHMRDNLKRISQEDHERSWASSGVAMFGDILRDNSDNLERLGKIVIGDLVKYLKANQGAFFVYDEKENNLKIVSAYAYEKYKYLQKSLNLGEGLVGQAFLEREKIHLTEIPEDYSDISSGLGKARPRSILVMPLKMNEKIYGVLELASLDDFKPYEIDFVESISEDIAMTISIIKANEETRRLLTESQKATQQLRQQEEEMRQNFEELMATQEEMKKRQEQIDALLHGKVNLTQLIDNEEIMKFNAKNSETEKARIDRLLRDAILQQKEILDSTFSKNQIREQIIKAKVEQINNQNGKSK